MPAPTGCEQIDDESSEFKMVKMHAKRLGEHFDSVLIMVTRFDHESEKTTQLCSGQGNYSARLGFAIEWLEKEKANLRREAEEDF